MFIVNVLVILFLIKFIVDYVIGKKNNRKIKKNWGNIIEEARNLSLIEKYSNGIKDIQQIKLTAQTLVDIDIEGLFNYLDRTTSRVGQQFFYSKLLQPNKEIELLKKLNDKIEFFKINQKVREKIQASLIKLNKPDAYYIADFFDDKNYIIPTGKFFLWVMSILPFCIIVLSFFFMERYYFLFSFSP